MARILVIDDDELVLSTVEIILSKAGHEVLTATNGRDGLDLWATVRPDLLLTDILNVDILMPELDGIETIRALRAKAGDSPIIAMSGSDPSRNADLLQMARDAGANDILSKPFKKEHLLAMVERCLKG